MQKEFITQPSMFVASSDLEHPALHALDGAESVLNWHHLEKIMEDIYGSKTGRPSYPLL